MIHKARPTKPAHFNPAFVANGASWDDKIHETRETAPMALGPTHVTHRATAHNAVDPA